MYALLRLTLLLCSHTPVCMLEQKNSRMASLDTVFTFIYMSYPHDIMKNYTVTKLFQIALRIFQSKAPGVFYKGSLYIYTCWSDFPVGLIAVIRCINITYAFMWCVTCHRFTTRRRFFRGSLGLNKSSYWHAMTSSKMLTIKRHLWIFYRYHSRGYSIGFFITHQGRVPLGCEWTWALLLEKECLWMTLPIFGRAARHMIVFYSYKHAFIFFIQAWIVPLSAVRTSVI